MNWRGAEGQPNSLGLTEATKRAARSASPIEIISASAGSGKTTRLAEVLDAEIAPGRARPDGVLATTFTRKAAAELEERARKRLLAAAALESARDYAGQLDAYSAAIEAATGRAVVGRYIHLLLTGAMVEVRPMEAASATAPAGA